MSTNNIDYSKFFKAYDLRGTTPELDYKVYYLAGIALVDCILKPQNLPLDVVVFRDTRLSSPIFYNFFIQGLIKAGAQVKPCGLGSTDMMYAGAIAYNCCGAMITASHNPKDDNGLKIVKKIPQMLGLAGGLDKIRDYVVANINNPEVQAMDENNLITIEEDQIARSTSIQLLKSRALEISTDLAQLLNKKVVVDSANGMGAIVFQFLVELYPNIEFIPLYCELDGNFPNHPADPIDPKNLVDLGNKITEVGADFGIAFDGDADRAFFVDQNGKPVNGENLVAIFGVEMAKFAQTQKLKNPEYPLTDSVCYVITYSRALANEVIMADGVPIVTKQGHTFVKSKMAQYKAIYGGEASGHHYFGTFGAMDSGLLAVSLLLKVLSKNPNTPLSDITKELDLLYFTSGENNIRLTSQQPNLEECIKIIKSTYSDGIISLLDGITVYYPKYKFTLRGSNTEPLLRINVESQISKAHQVEVFDQIIKTLGL
jgi:phosphomannomutase